MYAFTFTNSSNMCHPGNYDYSYINLVSAQFMREEMVIDCKFNRRAGIYSKMYLRAINVSPYSGTL